MLEIIAIIIAGFLFFPPEVTETRKCLVEVNGQCTSYDFNSSRNENPMGNAKELIDH
jgi:hypothetical protein